jgi:hypothetical protein
LIINDNGHFTALFRRSYCMRNNHEFAEIFR